MTLGQWWTTKRVGLLLLLLCTAFGRTQQQHTDDSTSGTHAPEGRESRLQNGRRWSQARGGPYQRVVSALGDGAETQESGDAAVDETELSEERHTEVKAKHNKTKQWRGKSSQDEAVPRTTVANRLAAVSEESVTRPQEAVRDVTRSERRRQREQLTSSPDDPAASSRDPKKRRRQSSPTGLSSTTGSPQTMSDSLYNYFRPLEQDLPQEAILPFLDFGRKLTPAVVPTPGGLNSIESTSTRSRARPRPEPVDEESLPEDMDVTVVKKAVERNTVPRGRIQLRPPAGYSRKRMPRPPAARTAENLVMTTDCSTVAEGNKRKADDGHVIDKNCDLDGTTTKLKEVVVQPIDTIRSSSIPAVRGTIPVDFGLVPRTIPPRTHEKLQQFEVVSSGNVSAPTKLEYKFDYNRSESESLKNVLPAQAAQVAQAISMTPSESSTEATLPASPQLTTRILSTAVVTSVSVKEQPKSATQMTPDKTTDEGPVTKDVLTEVADAALTMKPYKEVHSDSAMAVTTKLDTKDVLVTENIVAKGISLRQDIRPDNQTYHEEKLSTTSADLLQTTTPMTTQLVSVQNTTSETTTLPKSLSEDSTSAPKSTLPTFPTSTIEVMPKISTTLYSPIQSSSTISILSTDIEEDESVSKAMANSHIQSSSATSILSTDTEEEVFPNKMTTTSVVSSTSSEKMQTESPPTPLLMYTSTAGDPKPVTAISGPPADPAHAFDGTMEGAELSFVPVVRTSPSSAEENSNASLEKDSPGSEKAVVKEEATNLNITLRNFGFSSGKNWTTNSRTLGGTDVGVVMQEGATIIFCVLALACVLGLPLVALFVRIVVLRSRIKVLDESEYSSEYNRSPISVTSSPLPTKLPRVPAHLGWESEKQQPPMIAPVVSARWEFPREKLRLQTVLGQGNFGQVWKAEADDISGHEGLTRLVAVKTVKEGASSREREDLLRELGIMQELGTHPNVVTLLGCCTEKEPYLLIMEYVMFGKMLAFLREHRTRAHYYNFSDAGDALTSRDLTVFAYCVARGMDYLANKGIIHRDLAARNILVDHNKLCKIADFGMSRNVRDTGQIYEQRQSKGALPIRWMAPESLHMSLFTHKTDVWSYGILLWEIVTLGSIPYATMGAREVMRRVREGYRLERPDHCRTELFKVISRCWHSEPGKRPTFSELKQDIGLLLGDSDERDGRYVDLELMAEEMSQRELSRSSRHAS